VALYAIRIKGRLGATARSAFPGMDCESRRGETVLTGVLEDQSALFGVLGQIEALGLELLELRRSPRSGEGAITWVDAIVAPDEASGERR